jgi:hypothetical protein
VQHLCQIVLLLLLLYILLGSPAVAVITPKSAACLVCIPAGSGTALAGSHHDCGC